MKKIVLISLIYLIAAPLLFAQDDTFTDPRDATEYEVIRIGGKLWFAENLKFKTDNSLIYDKNDGNLKYFGRLYSWEEANTVCPEGWHLPSDEDWKALESSIGIGQEDLNKKGYRGENARKLIVHGETGFKVQFAGYFYYEANNYFQAHEFAHFWTSTKFGNNYAWKRVFKKESDQINRTHVADIKDKCSVRCVKD